MDSDNLVGVLIDDKYKLNQKIGEGGMGAVYLGTQLMVDRHVAIKLLHTGLSGHERIKQRFEVEAKAIGRMHHPNCITLFDFGFSTELDAFYMVMEYLDGTPMHRRVVEGVSAQEAVDITRQIAMALDHAHHQKILHRDLKPENVMLTRMTDGSELVKVLDFGIARIFQDEDDAKSTQEQNRLTRAGEVFGTPAYISPEQARGERELTPSSDLYSLGVMLYEMLQGELPFWGETAIDTIMKHITSPIPQLTRLDVPASLKELTYNLLSKDPSLRPQTGRELAERLAQISMQQRQPAMVGAMAHGMGAGSIGSPAHSNLSQEFPFVPDQGSTIPELGMNSTEMNEWSATEQTVVQTARPTHHTGPPMAHLVRSPNFGAEQLTDRQTVPDLDSLEAGISSRAKLLIPALIILGIVLIAAGAAIALRMDSASNERGQPTAEVTQHNDAITDLPAETSVAKKLEPPRNTQPSLPEEKLETLPPGKEVEVKELIDEPVKEPEVTPKATKKIRKKTPTKTPAPAQDPKKKPAVEEKKDDTKIKSLQLPSL